MRVYKSFNVLLTYCKDIVSHFLRILILRLRVNLCDIYVNCVHYFLYIKKDFFLLLFLLILYYKDMYLFLIYKIIIKLFLFYYLIYFLKFSKVCRYFISEPLFTLQLFTKLSKIT